MFFTKSSEEPWKISWLLRVLLIPATYKNYIIASMDIPFWQYFLPATVYYIPYWSMYLLVGISIASIQDLMKHKINKNGKYITFLINRIKNILCLFVLFFYFLGINYCFFYLFYCFDCKSLQKK